LTTATDRINVETKGPLEALLSKMEETFRFKGCLEISHEGALPFGGK
jgi:hypothetical protein